jgi:hypothetical protein
MLTREQRQQAIKLQDAIGEIVDQFLRDGMRPEVIREVLRDEENQVAGRKLDIESGNA